MNDARTRPDIDTTTPARQERRAAALVAEYINDISDRHAGEREGSRAAAAPGAAAQRDAPSDF